LQGEWKPKQIDNPNYKGEWVHPEIDNPDYVEDKQLYMYKDIGVIGFDLWQVRLPEKKYRNFFLLEAGPRVACYLIFVDIFFGNTISIQQTSYGIYR
jgi:hypothetical protein